MQQTKDAWMQRIERRTTSLTKPETNIFDVMTMFEDMWDDPLGCIGVVKNRIELPWSEARPVLWLLKTAGRF